ncbi:MAG: hypothetical protein FWF03_06495, partial [Defluviitaleaceae bacterium]|nr:hypothetical protein [Defluviitaleaceae bacterium]
KICFAMTLLALFSLAASQPAAAKQSDCAAHVCGSECVEKLLGIDESNKITKEEMDLLLEEFFNRRVVIFVDKGIKSCETDGHRCEYASAGWESWVDPQSQSTRVCTVGRHDKIRITDSYGYVASHGVPTIPHPKYCTYVYVYFWVCDACKTTGLEETPALTFCLGIDIQK